MGCCASSEDKYSPEQQQAQGQQGGAPPKHGAAAGGSSNGKHKAAANSSGRGGKQQRAASSAVPEFGLGATHEVVKLLGKGGESGGLARGGEAGGKNGWRLLAPGVACSFGVPGWCARWGVAQGLGARGWACMAARAGICMHLDGPLPRPQCTTAAPGVPQ